MTCRQGVSRAQAQEEVRSRTTLIGAMLVRRGDADAMLCGTSGDYLDHLGYIRRVIGMRSGTTMFAAMQMLILPERQLFFCDTHVNHDPSAAQIAEMTLMAAEQVQRFGITPSVALVSHSSFGSSNAASAQKMRDALALITARAPELAIEGEMRADSALSSRVAYQMFPDTRLATDAKCTDHAQCGCRQHCVQHLAHCRQQQRYRRRHFAGRGKVRSYHDAIGFGQAHCRHDGICGCRSRHRTV